jgi:genome maintenance exonuclease 1
MMEFIHEKIDMGYVDLDRRDSEDGRRYVTLDGNAYPSVTTILSILSEESIAKWRAKVGEEEANKVSLRATTRGTAVHAIIEKYMNNDPNYAEGYLPHVVQSLENLKPLLNKHVTKVYAQEVPLYSDHLQMAGTCDAVVEWDGVPTIVDWKTSRRPKKKANIGNYFMQLAAYAVMWEERTGMPIQQTRIVMDVDDFHPVMYKETRDAWIDKMIETRDEYNRRKLFHG